MTKAEASLTRGTSQWERRPKSRRWPSTLWPATRWQSPITLVPYQHFRAGVVYMADDSVCDQNATFIIPIKTPWELPPRDRRTDPNQTPHEARL